MRWTFPPALTSKHAPMVTNASSHSTSSSTLPPPTPPTAPAAATAAPPTLPSPSTECARGRLPRGVMTRAFPPGATLKANTRPLWRWLVVAAPPAAAVLEVVMAWDWARGDWGREDILRRRLERVAEMSSCRRQIALSIDWCGLMIRETASVDR